MFLFDSNWVLGLYGRGNGQDLTDLYIYIYIYVCFSPCQQSRASFSDPSSTERMFRSTEYDTLCASC